jgi:hypothetical protein
MIARFGDTEIHWQKFSGNILIKCQCFNDFEGESEDYREQMTLFEFLSRLGLTAAQCAEAFAAEDKK